MIDKFFSCLLCTVRWPGNSCLVESVLWPQSLRLWHYAGLLVVSQVSTDWDVPEDPDMQLIIRSKIWLHSTYSDQNIMQLSLQSFLVSQPPGLARKDSGRPVVLPVVWNLSVQPNTAPKYHRNVRISPHGPGSVRGFVNIAKVSDKLSHGNFSTINLLACLLYTSDAADE